MRRLIAILAFSIATATPAFAQPNHPWESDQKLLDATTADIDANGILSVKTRIAELEHALAGAKDSFALAEKGDGDTNYVLADGSGSSLAGLLGATISGKKTGKTIAVPNPYPMISLYLGSYYDESGKGEDAARVLGAGLALPSIELSDLYAPLLIERGAALSTLKRWPDALASYEQALKIPDVDNATRAYMHRGRGGALVEMDKLDEAEAAYNKSLEFAPGNKIALNELKYIAQLRAGGPRTDSNLTSVQPKQN